MDKERKHKRLDLGAYTVQHHLDEAVSKFDRKGRCVPEADVSYIDKCWVAMDIDTLMFFALFKSDQPVPMCLENVLAHSVVAQLHRSSIIAQCAQNAHALNVSHNNLRWNAAQWISVQVAA